MPARPEELRGMGRRARAVFQERYAAEVAYGRLMEIYGKTRR